MPKHPFKILLCIHGSTNLVTAKKQKQLKIKKKKQKQKQKTKNKK